ncbi:hypothetical protein HS088_TW04G01177 [Tripterygium wilfordii]|uniref:Uncharacterized protein n=1 Tax=Tripterygium wilfordii TaxID=458696 RepID=A0A7J7DSD9_TRIWF|nr:hypothetical protein HS088_TW04G01177 [Tripterygium wilfordii]
MDDKKSKDVGRNLNVNEEYLSALRTKSYAEFLTKAQLLLVNEHPSSPSFCHHKFSKSLLEPRQENIPSILESTIFEKTPQLKTLILNYFDISAEASKFCSHLLKNINHVYSNYEFIRRAIDTIDDHNYSSENVHQIISDLNSFIIQNNPFSNPNMLDFKLIHDKYSSVLRRLKLKGKKLARKIKLIRCIENASGICITATIGLVAITTIVALAHTLAGLVMAPAIFSFSFNNFKKTKFLSFQFKRSCVLKKLRDQIDVAAKGTYILDRDFDTMSRLVARLYDEVEHKKTMIKFCLERGDDKFSLQIVKELKKSDVGFRKQVEELEEQVYLCLATINRARALVIKESLRQ